MKEARGFTMIELSVVLGMIVVVAAFSVPMLTNSMRNMQLIADARNIATTMTYAKMSAMSQMTRYRLSFDLDSNTWRLLKRNRATGEYEPEQAINGLSNGVSHSGIEFKPSATTAPNGFPTSSSTTITFNSRGIPESAGIIYISNDELDYAVSVSLAGKVQIWRYQNNQWTSN